jgi:hypothetical protein
MLIITHGLKNLPNYAFSGNGLYRLAHFSNKRTKPLRKLKLQTMNKNSASCNGYFIEGKFRSKTSLEKRKYPTTKIIIQTETLPF